MSMFCKLTSQNATLKCHCQYTEGFSPLHIFWQRRFPRRGLLLLGKGWCELAVAATWEAGSREEADAETGEEVDRWSDAEERGDVEGARSTQRGSQRAKTHPQHQRSLSLSLSLSLSSQPRRLSVGLSEIPGRVIFYVGTVYIPKIKDHMDNM